MPDVPVPSPFASNVASVALAQHDAFHLIDESDEPLTSQIAEYWQAVGQTFPGVSTAWSAVFISFCVKTAGATSNEFEFSAAHAKFVHDAINNPRAFRGFKITEQAVHVGDIIQNNRGGNAFDFTFAKNNDGYFSHSAIVISRGVDANGKFAITVGGNESDSIRRKRVQLNDDGTIRQRTDNSYICLLKNQK
jgi:hypothetical protein